MVRVRSTEDWWEEEGPCCRPASDKRSSRHCAHALRQMFVRPWTSCLFLVRTIEALLEAYNVALDVAALFIDVKGVINCWWNVSFKGSLFALLNSSVVRVNLTSKKVTKCGLDEHWTIYARQIRVSFWSELLETGSKFFLRANTIRPPWESLCRHSTWDVHWFWQEILWSSGGISRKLPVSKICKFLINSEFF